MGKLRQGRAGHGRAGQGRVVGRRRVFFVPGYDPSPPRRYRELFRTEGAAQAAISGYEIAMAPRPEGRSGGRFGWEVAARMDGAEVEARVEVLAWSDIVQASLGAGIAGTYGQLVRTAWIYGSSGALGRLARLRKGPLIAALYPVAVLMAQLAVALGLGAALGRVAAVGLGAVVGTALGVGVAILLLRWFKGQDRWLMAHYLMHDFAFTAWGRGAYAPALESRLAAFADAVAEALGDGCDEVLVVGHSSGAHLAVSVVADLVRAGRVPADGPALSLLTLGHVVPMASFLPRATRLRADLALLAAEPGIPWVDVSAPGDGCAFALCDPVAVSGVAPAGQRWPLVLSAAFTRTLSPERRRALRWRVFRLHVQYLCAFDRPGDYDYFRIVGGPLTLGDRFAGRASSRSRIAGPPVPRLKAAA